MTDTCFSLKIFALFIFGYLSNLCNAERCDDFYSDHCEKNLPVPALIGAIVGPIFLVFVIVVFVCACCQYRRRQRMLGAVNYVEQRTYYTQGVGMTHMTYIATGGPSSAGVTGYHTQPHGACLTQYPVDPVTLYPPTECPPPQYPPYQPSECPPTQYPSYPTFECPPPQYPSCPP